MFGYVVANTDQLPEELKKIYSSYYCGLCRCLKQSYGNFGRLTLNYDITFMTLLLADLADPETTLYTARCVAHPAKQREMAENEVIRYGAAMNILLAYYNLMDDWQDEGKRTALTAANRLKKYIPAIRAQYPRQAAAVEEGMAALAREEATAPRDPDTAANIFGRLLGELFILREDHWSADCRAFGAALGQFVYWMDAYEDLPKDRKKGRYNPLILLADRPDYEARIEEMLKGALGDCALILERLPLVEHLDILRNILYSGIWSKYEKIKKEKADGSKSL